MHREDQRLRRVTRDQTTGYKRESRLIQTHALIVHYKFNKMRTHWESSPFGEAISSVITYRNTAVKQNLYNPAVYTAIYWKHRAHSFQSPGSQCESKNKHAASIERRKLHLK